MMIANKPISFVIEILGTFIDIASNNKVGSKLGGGVIGT